MKGIYLESEGQPPFLRSDLPEPDLRPGGVVVRMKAAPVLSYTRDVLNGKLQYIFPTPFVPGNSGVGVVDRVSDDVSYLRPGQWVNIDPRIAVHSSTKPDEADAILIGLTASTPESVKLQQQWRDGSYAEKALVPAECLTPIETLAHLPPEKLALLSHIAVPYGGLIRGNLRSGHTVLINGATGAFGARALVVALALGAGRVIAVGRDENTLAVLRDLDPKRVMPFVLGKGSVEEQSAKLREIAGSWGVDLYFDMLGRASEPDSILACIGALRHRGTAVFMGGVRISIPFAYGEIMHRELTIIGNFMYARGAIRELVALIESGILNLHVFNTNPFPLDAFDSAFDHAKNLKGLDSVCLLM